MGKSQEIETVFKAEFTESFKFVVKQNTDLLSIKVIAAFIEKIDVDERTGEDIEITSEKMFQQFNYKLKENYTKLFDQQF